MVAYIAGFTAPPGKQMGHAGAIVSGQRGHGRREGAGARSQGVRVGRTPTEVAAIAVEVLGGAPLALLSGRASPTATLARTVGRGRR